MRPLSSLYLVFCFVLLGCGLVLWNLDSFWSQSVDLAHHYALIVRISEHHSFDIVDLTLGEMNFYPRLSHVIAAVVATIVGSNLLGMQVVTLLSVSLLWGSYIYALRGLPRQLAMASTLVLAFLFLLNRYLFKFEVHGAEVIDNFFFSQLVAQAFVVLGLAVAIHFESKGRRIAAYFLLTALVFVTTSTHLLPALELLVVLLCLLFLNLLVAFYKKDARISTAFTFVSFSSLALCAVLLNPAFAAMRKISENNGDLHFKYISFPIGLSGICVITIMLGLGFLGYYLRYIDRRLVALKYIALYGFAQATLCLLQLVLAKYGIGSDYAVKKYGFGLLSYIFVSLAIIVGALLVSCLKRRPWFGVSSDGIGGGVVVLVCYCVVVVCSLPRNKHFDAFELANIERDLTRLTTTELPLPNPSQSNVIFGIHGLPPQFNYMFSIALARTPRGLAIPDVLFDKMSDYENYTYIVSQNESLKYDVGDCEVRVAGDFSMVKGECLAMRAKQSLHCAGKFDFSKNGFVNPRMLTGFSQAEQGGRWMDGGKSSVTCDVAMPPPSQVKIFLQPLFVTEVQQQRLEIIVNGISVMQSIYVPDRSVGELTIPLPSTSSDGKYEISFITPDGFSLKALGLSEDPRVLSFFIKSIEFR